MSFTSLPWTRAVLPVLTIGLAGCYGPSFGLGTGPFELLILGLVIGGLHIAALVEVARSDQDMAVKLLWILIILSVPIIGLIIYFFMGR
jgi:hypothetical protein